jgi:L-threonylcarbamoyladenylate synthase
MMPLVLPYDHPDTSDAVHSSLEAGQTLIFPTDTIYGIGGNPWDERTLRRVRSLKQRNEHQPFTLHLHSVTEISKYALCAPPERAVLERLLPGPITVLLPATPASPPSTVLHGVVGVRVPDHAFFSEVLRQPVFATSVNRHGEPPLNDVNHIIESFHEVDLLITGPISGAASAILDLTKRPYRLVRGTLSDELLRKLEQE